MRGCVVLLFAALLGCADPGGAGNTVSVVDNAFSPQTVTVTPGSTVGWVWAGAVPHDVVFADGPSSAIQSTGQWDRTFPTAGTFDYVCSLHGGMTGRVIVQ